MKKTSAGNFGKFNLKDLISRAVCTDEKEDCFEGSCEECAEETVIDILIGDSIIDFDDECSWTMWKKMNNKFDLQHIIGSVDSLLTTIEESWPTFLLHTYHNRQQRDYIKELRSQSTDKTFIVARIDFSMNYTLIRQREVQQGFFSQQQVTVFTVHLTIGLEHRNLARISDHLEHTTAFVYCAQKILVQFIKKNYLLVKKINYVR